MKATLEDIWTDLFLKLSRQPAVQGRLKVKKHTLKLIAYEKNETHMGGVSLSGILANQQRSGFDVKFKQPILFSFCSRKWLYEHQDHFEPEGLSNAGNVDFERPSWLCTRVYDERTRLPL